MKQEFYVIDLETGDKSKINYPRKDLAPLRAMGRDMGRLTKQFYFIEDEIPKNFNPIYQTLKKTEEFTDELYQNKLHIKICKVKNEIVKLSQDEIIINLNNDLGFYLDNEYPIWEREKHNSQLLYFQYTKKEDDLDEEDEDIINYILSTFEWAEECRALRAKYENDLALDLKVNIIYPKRPLKLN